MAEVREAYRTKFAAILRRRREATQAIDVLEPTSAELDHAAVTDAPRLVAATAAAAAAAPPRRGRVPMRRVTALTMATDGAPFVAAWKSVDGYLRQWPVEVNGAQYVIAEWLMVMGDAMLALYRRYELLPPAIVAHRTVCADRMRHNILQQRWRDDHGAAAAAAGPALPTPPPSTDPALAELAEMVLVTTPPADRRAPTIPAAYRSPEKK